MFYRRLSGALLGLLVATAFAADAGNPPRLSAQSRMDIIRTFTAEGVFCAALFPQGKVGLKIENGQVFPGVAEVRQLAAASGPVCRPGERAQITSLRFTGHAIVFEINGGPLRRKKWWQNIQVGAGDVASPSGSSPDDVYNHARGSCVMLAFKDYVPELTTGQVKEMLAPALDFKGESVAEAYLKSLPPKLQRAVKEHKALVGMDREMVTYAKGRPSRRIREADGATQYEEWIYGQPPSEVEFIRFVGDSVVQIETMKVDGEKIVRTEPEVDLASGVSTMARRQAKARETSVARPLCSGPVKLPLNPIGKVATFGPPRRAGRRAPEIPREVSTQVRPLLAGCHHREARSRPAEGRPDRPAGRHHFILEQGQFASRQAPE